MAGDREDGPDDGAPLDAGRFSTWLGEVGAAIEGAGESDVPCGTCTACCTSSQFVHIGPDETDALAHIPPALTFPAPGLPVGHVLLGYDGQGRCPMLVDGGCSIYAHRPRTCRTYDCRVFPATGLVPDEHQVQIARRTRRWAFEVVTEDDRSRLAATRAAAAYLRDHGAELTDPAGPALPTNPTQRAVLAIEIHTVFLTGGDGQPAPGSEPDPASVRRAVAEVVARRQSRI